MTSDPKPLAECRKEDLTNHHALVYGRARIWCHSLTDAHAMEWRWSACAWWKALHYSHRGPPSKSGSWGIYGGHDGFSGPGDAELSHFLPMPPVPST